MWHLCAQKNEAEDFQDQRSFSSYWIIKGMLLELEPRGYNDSGISQNAYMKKEKNNNKKRRT